MTDLNPLPLTPLLDLFDGSGHRGAINAQIGLSCGVASGFFVLSKVGVAQVPNGVRPGVAAVNLERLIQFINGVLVSA